MREEGWRLRTRVRLDGDATESGGALVDTYTGTLCACNATAWTLLCTLRSGATLGELVAQLTTYYQVKAKAARKDALDFVHQLTSMDLLNEDE